jgi:hypothetical protein
MKLFIVFPLIVSLATAIPAGEACAAGGCIEASACIASSPLKNPFPGLCSGTGPTIQCCKTVSSETGLFNGDIKTYTFAKLTPSGKAMFEQSLLWHAYQIQPNNIGNFPQVQLNFLNFFTLEN